MHKLLVAMVNNIGILMAAQINLGREIICVTLHKRYVFKVMVELQINIFCQFIDWQNECNSGFFDKVSLTTFGIVWTMLIAEILPFVSHE